MHAVALAPIISVDTELLGLLLCAAYNQSVTTAGSNSHAQWCSVIAAAAALSTVTAIMRTVVVCADKYTTCYSSSDSVNAVGIPSAAASVTSNVRQQQQ
jgi:hypothetical protein